MTPDHEDLLADEWWRLNNLYYIKNKQGERELFKPNWAQKILYTTMWYLGIILKARQLGMTTFIQIFILDRALFNSDINCGIVAHNKDDAEAFFRDKIKYAYDNLPEDLREAIPATSNTARTLQFANGSTIRVGTSLRSGTYQYVHVSEFGKMCAKYPDKAEEVVTGTLNAVAAGQFVFIESTAEGPFGEFYDMCNTAEDFQMAVENGDAEYTSLDYKFFFFPWHKHPDYVLDAKVEIPPELVKYFAGLEEEHDIVLTAPQKAWYVKKAAEQGERMKQEYPSIPSEAFERTTDVAILGKQLKTARREKRITRLPIVKGVPVNTFWDLGKNDYTAIWFHQNVEGKDHFIYYYYANIMHLGHYAKILQELKQQYGWYYGDHYLPHDGAVVESTQAFNLTRREVLIEAGLMNITVLPRIRNLIDGIELLRRKFDNYYFDEEGCEAGMRALHAYEWQYDSVQKMTRQVPVKNFGIHGADALRQHAQGYRGANTGFKKQMEQQTGGGRQYSQKRRGRGTLLNPTYNHIV